MSDIKNKQSLIGKVISTKMDNTVNVEVTRVIAHPTYKKELKSIRNFFLMYLRSYRRRVM